MMRPLIAPALTLLLTASLWAGAPTPPAPLPPPGPLAAPAAPGPVPTPEMGQPTLITLHYKDATPAAIFKDLGTQIGREFVTSSGDLNSWPAVSIDADKEPYWNVIARLDDALGFDTNLRPDGKINLNRGTRRNGIRYVSGPCMLVLSMIRHDANFTTPDFPDNCILNVTLFFEPNLSVATFSGRVRPDLAVDERGNSLVPPPELLAPTNLPAGMRASPPLGFGSGIQGVDAAVKPYRLNFESTFQIILAPPANAGYRIARVKGDLHLNIIEKSTDIEIPASEFTQTRTADFHGARITISPILSPAPAGGPASPQRYSVSLNIQRGGLSDDEWGKVNDLLDAIAVSVLDDNNAALTNSGGGGGGGRASTNRMISYSYSRNQGPGTLDAPGTPVKCRIRLPDATRDIPIPFEFQDLPLP